MKIGVFTHDFYPIIWGIWNHTWNMYQESLNDEELEILFFSPNKNDLKNHIQIFPQYWYYNSKTKNIWFSIILSIYIEKIIKKYNLDKVHVHGWPWWLFLLQKLSVPLMVTSHHTYHQQYTIMKWQSRKKIFYYIEKKFYHLADKIICVSEDTQLDILTYYNIERTKTVVIYNWIKLDEYLPYKINSNEKEENSICYIWRLDHRKWIDRLFEQFPSMLEQNSNYILYVMWKWPLTDRCNEFIINHNLQKSIIMLWFVTEQEKKTRIAKSKLLIVPSVFEWFWIVALEWLALWTDIATRDVVWFSWLKKYIAKFSNKMMYINYDSFPINNFDISFIYALTYNKSWE